MTLLFERITEVVCRAISALLYGFIWLFGSARLVEDIERDPTSPTEPMPSTPEGRQGLLRRLNHKTADRLVDRFPHVWVHWNARERDQLLESLAWTENLHSLRFNTQFFIDNLRSSSDFQSDCCDPRARCGPCHTAAADLDARSRQRVEVAIRRYEDEFQQEHAIRKSAAASQMIGMLAAFHAKARSEPALEHIRGLVPRIRSAEAVNLLANLPIHTDITAQLIMKLEPSHAGRILLGRSRMPSDLRPRVIDRLDKAAALAVLESDWAPPASECTLIRQRFDIQSREKTEEPTSPERKRAA